MNSLVSIIMPAFNAERYIKESINSIRQQTFKNWELIIINDGSTDGTFSIASDFAQKDPRIKIHSQENGGEACARNTGLVLASGKYISFLDSDDLWEPTFLSEMLEKQECTASDILYCGYFRLYENGRTKKYQYQYPAKWDFTEAILELDRLHVGALLVNQKLISDNKIFFTVGCKIGADQEFILKVLSLTEKVGFVPKELMLYRKRSGSLMNQKWDWKNHIHYIQAHHRAVEFVNQRLSDDYGIISAMKERLAYRLSKFLWKMVRKGYHEETLNIMGDPQYSEILTYIDQNRLGLLRRLKYNVVISRNQKLWYLSKVLFNF